MPLRFSNHLSMTVGGAVGCGFDGAAGRGFDGHSHNRQSTSRSTKAITPTMIPTIAPALSGCDWALRVSVAVCDGGAASAGVSAGAGSVAGAEALAEPEGSAARVVVVIVAAVVTVPTMQIGREGRKHRGQPLWYHVSDEMPAHSPARI